MLQHKIQQCAHVAVLLRRPLLFIAVLGSKEALALDRCHPPWNITKNRRIGDVIVRVLALQHQKDNEHQKGQEGVTCQLTDVLCVYNLYGCRARTLSLTRRVVRRYPASWRCICGARCLVTIWVPAALCRETQSKAAVKTLSKCSLLQPLFVHASLLKEVQGAA